MNAATQTLHFMPRPQRSLLANMGRALARHQRALIVVQWGVILFYAALVVVPAFLPQPAANARLFGDALWHERMTLAAQYLFWGVWWPFVILSILLLGRAWCGLLCPEGALSEFASRHGRGGRIPRWLRWRGWPLAAFVLTTVYGQLISVYDYPQAALLILGGSTAAAMAVGYFYGKGKRVWCRYLCPVSGVFSLLARVAPVHFRVDGAAWQRAPARTPAVDCAPLINVRHMQSAADCHACGRCAGHRDAVELAWRSPNAEVLHGAPLTHWDARLLVFGMIGVAIGAFQWTLNPWFVRARQAAAGWLIERDILWPLQDNAPWWLLTHQPAAGDVFTWLDGMMIVSAIALTAFFLGGAVWLGLRVSVWINRPRTQQRHWRTLAAALIPLAGAGLFLGLSMMSATHLRAEGVRLFWLSPARATLLGGGALWSLWLGSRLLSAWLARFVFALAVALICSAWVMMFFVW